MKKKLLIGGGMLTVIILIILFWPKKKKAQPAAATEPANVSEPTPTPVIEDAAILPPVPELKMDVSEADLVANKVGNPVYGMHGVFLYDKGYNKDGSGKFEWVLYDNPFWTNLVMTSTDGVVNRNAIFNPNIPDNTPTGLVFSISVDKDMDVLMGIAGDNTCSINQNGAPLVTLDVNAVAQNINQQMNATWRPDGTTNFKFFHIFPVSLVKGENSFSATVTNFGGDGAFAFEVYNNTPTEIKASTSYENLDVLLSSGSLDGQQVFTIL